MRFGIVRPGLYRAPGRGNGILEPLQLDQTNRHGIQAGLAFAISLSLTRGSTTRNHRHHHSAGQVGARLEEIRFQLDRDAKRRDGFLLVTCCCLCNAKKIVKSMAMRKPRNQRGLGDGVLNPAGKVAAIRQAVGVAGGCGKTGIGQGRLADPEAALCPYVSGEPLKHAAEPVAGLGKLVSRQSLLGFLQLCLDTRRHGT